MFIHKNKAIGGFKFKQKYPASFGALAGSPHLGTDWKSNYEPIYAPCDGRVSKVIYGVQGGWWIYFEETQEASKYEAQKLIHRFSHCDGGKIKGTGEYKEGDIIGYSGNTGSATTGPHTHHDISRDYVDIYNINNFVDPEIYFNNLDMTQIPKWFTDNGTDKWAKEKFIRMDQTDLTEDDCKFLESLKKATQAPGVEVNMFFENKLFSKENEALELAVRDSVRFFLPYINLKFNAPQKANLDFSEGYNKFKPKKGLNIVILDDDTLENLKDNVNGFMDLKNRTAYIKRSLLGKEDSRNRGGVNAFACTLQHELMHWFGTYINLTRAPREDLTHHYDYSFTLANYLPLLAWGLIHDSAFRNKYNL